MCEKWSPAIKTVILTTMHQSPYTLAQQTRTNETSCWQQKRFCTTDKPTRQFWLSRTKISSRIVHWTCVVRQKVSSSLHPTREERCQACSETFEVEAKTLGKVTCVNLEQIADVNSLQRSGSSMLSEATRNFSLGLSPKLVSIGVRIDSTCHA